MTTAFARKQPELGLPTTAAVSLEWRRRADPHALWRVLESLALPEAVLGVGAGLVEAVGAEIPGLAAFERLQRGRYVMPSTPHDVWALVPGGDPGAAFDAADRVRAALAPVARLVESTPMFDYRQGRDLTGFQDGTENPSGDAAWEAALVADGEWAGASFALVQRYLHFRDRFATLPQRARDLTIGRSEAGDEEIAEAPETAHIKRTAQEDFDPPAFVLRRSMPWGDPRRHGLQFIAFMSDLGKARRLLERMVGLDDGRQDALLGHTQAETGAYYFCPPWVGGRLLLPPVAGPGPAPDRLQPAWPSVRLCENGPLELDGAFVVAGEPVAQARLCRCGGTRTPPFCDDSHRERGFVAPGEVPPLDEPQAAAELSRVRVQPLADGPLLLYGAVEIASASARTITRCVGPTLCRCGQSANKPFCDGSHARVGFRAPD